MYCSFHAISYYPDAITIDFLYYSHAISIVFLYYSDSITYTSKIQLDAALPFFLCKSDTNGNTALSCLGRKLRYHKKVIPGVSGAQDARITPPLALPSAVLIELIVDAARCAARAVR